MSRSFLQGLYLSFLVALSFLSLFLVTLPAVFPLPNQQDFPWRKPLIGSVFGLVCLLGMMAIFFPSYCSTIFQVGNTANRNRAFHIEKNTAFHKATTIFGLRVTHGHHPSCEGFATHEFQVGKRTFCTACGGLLLGAFIALLGAVAYFFLGWNIREDASSFLFSGVLSVGLGLFQYMFFDVQWRLIRFLLNAFFVFGGFLVLVGIDAVANSLIFDFFVIFFSVFWLFTRILLSKHVHNRICQSCNLECDVVKE